MSEDKLSKKRKIFIALRTVFESLDQDESGLEISLGQLLKDYDISGPAYIALGIKALGLIKVEKQSNGRKHCIVWNNSARPNEQMAEELISLAQKFKSGKFVVVDQDYKPIEEVTLKGQDSSTPLKVEQLDTEITRLRHELKLAHEETTLHKGKVIEALDRINDMVSLHDDISKTNTELGERNVHLNKQNAVYRQENLKLTNKLIVRKMKHRKMIDKLLKRLL